MKRVLIAGATGYLGKFVLQEFKKQGYYTCALSRSSSKLKALSKYIDEEFMGEVTNTDSLKGICKHIDIVFSSIGITNQKDNRTFMEVDYQGNKNLLEEAIKAGVSKFIFISVFNAKNMTDLKVIQAKLKFEKELKESGLDYLIVYPNGFFSDMLEYLKMAKKGRGFVFGSGENKINPIAGEDLAKACVDASAGNKNEMTIGGPDVFTHNEILTTIFNTYGRKSNIIKIPMWVRNLLLVIMRLFTSVKTYGPVEFFMTVLVMDLVAPAYGVHHLKDFLLENKEKI
ncbi:SDR family oxidoreductase [bacterium BMS3Abin03]|nr:SDR family oxidoreductase [bacterium BMS3Abin03]